MTGLSLKGGEGTWAFCLFVCLLSFFKLKLELEFSTKEAMHWSLTH